MLRQNMSTGLLLALLVALIGCGIGNGEAIGPALSREHTALAAPVSGDLVIFGDELASGWEDWSWNSTVDLANSTPVAGGTASLAVTYQQAWAGLSLRAPAPIDTTGFRAVTFRVHGGATGTRPLQFYVMRSDTDGFSPVYDLDAAAGSWQTITIPLSDLGNPPTIARISLQDRSGDAQPTFYLDDMYLEGTGVTPTPLPAPRADGTITLNATGNARPIDPRIRGTNLPTWLGADRLANGTFRARTAASGVTVIRIPGGSWSNHYGWLSCELRADQPKALPCGDNWGSWAARPTDFIDFLQATATQGMWVVSINSTPEEAAAAVAFFNATPNDSTVIGVDRNGFDWQTAGHWAQLRVDKGNPEPVGVKLWAVGNEVYGGRPASGGAQCAAWGWEDVWSCDGTEYVNGDGTHEGYAAFRTAMRAVDPSIQIGAVGVTPSSDYANWGNEVVAAAGNTMDFYDIHQYGFFEPPANNGVLLASPQSAWTTIMDNVRSTFANQAGGRAIPVGVTEYNLFSVQDQDNGQVMTRAINALYLADTIGRMVEEGIVIANQWDLANGRAGNGTEYGLMHEDNNYYRTPQYYVFPLWEHFGNTLLPTISTFDAGTELSVYGGQSSADSYSILAINKTAAPLRTTVTINGGTGPAQIRAGTVEQLQGVSLEAQAVTYNGVTDPADDLSDAPPLPLTITAPTNALTYDFPPYAVTLLRLQVGDGTGATPTATPTATTVSGADPTATPTLVPTAAADAQAIYLPVVTR
ncbi:MAG: hypothetical protein KDE53_11620 [Caldilineaceae bacterium]|nr:hypothetical protein [Caldilineaceae bacterium]